MTNLIFFGAPGAGKGTQAKKVAEKLQLIHFSTGEILRKAIASKNELGFIAKKYIDKGELLPDDMMIKIVDEEITKRIGSCNGFVFDGFPRTIRQAEVFNELLAKHDTCISHVIHLKVSKEILVNRMLKRAELENRKDDGSIAIIENRINLYIEKTTPIKEFYAKLGKMRKIDGTGDVNQIFDKIMEAIGK